MTLQEKRGGRGMNKFEQVSSDHHQMSLAGGFPGLMSRSSGRFGGGATPLRPKIFSISRSFSQNLAKSYVGAPLEGWRPLRWGIMDPPLQGDLSHGAGGIIPDLSRGYPTLWPIPWWIWCYLYPFPPWTDKHTCENITFLQLWWRVVNIVKLVFIVYFKIHHIVNIQIPRAATKCNPFVLSDTETDRLIKMSYYRPQTKLWEGNPLTGWGGPMWALPMIGTYLPHSPSPRHGTCLPTPIPLPPNMGPVYLPRPPSPKHGTCVPIPSLHMPLATDVWLSSLKTCSNMFTWGPTPRPTLVLTPNGSHWNTYSYQVGGMHPAGMLTCTELCSHCTETDTSTDFYWVLCQFIVVFVCLSLCVCLR